MALYSLTLFAQTGVVEKYQSYLKKQDSSFDLTLSNAKEIAKDELVNYTNLSLQKDFLNSILFYTPKRFLKLGTKDKCSFYDLILANSLQDKNGDIDQFLVSFTDQNDKVVKGKVDRTLFIQSIVTRECPKSIKFSRYFTLTNLSKTLKEFSFKTPKNINECSEVHQSFLKDHKTPYFCYLNQELKKISPLSNEIALTPSSEYKKLEVLKRKLAKAKKIDSMFNDSAKDYLSNLCLNLDKEKKFCNHFFDSNFYRQVKDKKESDFYVQNFCREIFNRYSPGILDSCINRLISEPTLCIGLNEFDKSLYPKPNCDEISEALNYSGLYAKYNDCPAEVENDTIINVSRLLRHFSKEDYSLNKDCALNSVTPYVSYNLESNGEEYWKNKICFDDRINKVEVCYPTIYGESKNENISLTANVKKILERTRGMSKNTDCKIVSQQEYNPVFLKFQSGCYIIRPSFKIVFDQEEIKLIRFKNEFNYDYFASSYLNEGKSQDKLLLKNLNLKTRPILNTTLLKEHFKNKPKSILHAMACAQALYPSFFNTKSLNTCSPIAVIIDGYIESNSEVSLIVRSSLDSIHAPRIVSWRDVFNGVKSYQRIHPLNKWSLNAIYN